MAHPSLLHAAARPEVDSDADSAAPPESYINELRPEAAARELRDPQPLREAERPSLEVVEPQLPAAHSLVKALVAAGVDTFFGIPGGPVSPVFDAILQVRGARLIESRHETAAAFAAADFQRASGRTPAVVVTAGPGATNVVTGVVSAHLERVPMLVICGDVAWAADGARLLQDSGPEGIAVEKLLANVTRVTVRVSQAKTATAQGLAALDAAQNPANPGPSLLVLPIQLGRAMARPAAVATARTDFQARPSRDLVATAARALLRAKRPLLVLGAGCRPHAAAMRRLVDALNVPFVTTPQAKGLVSEQHPRSLRHGGLAASLWAKAYTGAGVDAALVLGTDLDDCSVGPTRYVSEGGRLIHVDLNAAVFGRNLPTELGIVADVAAFADDLYEMVVQEGLRHSGANALLRETRQLPAFEHADFESDDSPRITPQRAIADLQAAAGPDAAFITDIGEHMLSALHYLTAQGPDSFTIHLGLGSMGSGISGAIGLALARPRRPVICVCGDGGMQMSGMEALVALKYRLPIVYAVFNDARYNMVYHGYRQVFGREAAWDSPWTDFAKWARSMGMAGLRINHPGEIDAAMLRRVHETGLPLVLDIRIDRDKRVTGGGRNEALQHMSLREAAGS
ncbi:MAG TPA: thiamine pyrophosphate-binding protein [Polyangiaceae bacterium]|nr:thiamine pyrophosphate-binding protein [Polyangiaceae bacterium]